MKALAREGRKLAALIGETRRAGCAIARARWAARCGRSRARSAGAPARPRPRCSSSPSRPASCSSARSSEARAAGRVARGAGRAGAARRPSCAPPRRLEELADRCEKVAEQIRQRVAGEPITDRIVSLSDPDARPIRKGKLGKPNEFGYVSQLAEVTENTKRGARGFILPAADRARATRPRTRCCPSTVAELERLGLSPREVALDGGFNAGPTNDALAELAPETRLHRRPPAARLAGAPSAACSATAPAPRAASATSNAATASTAAASRATRASRSGLAGRSSPTTPTPTPNSPDPAQPQSQRAGAANASRTPTGPLPPRAAAGTYPDAPASSAFIRGK